MALALGKLDKTTGIAFARLFDSLKLSMSKQREIFSLVNEIAHRDDLPMLAVLEAPALQAVLNDSHFDRNQRAQKIRKYLVFSVFLSLFWWPRSFIYILL